MLKTTYRLQAVVRKVQREDTAEVGIVLHGVDDVIGEVEVDEIVES